MWLFLLQTAKSCKTIFGFPNHFCWETIPSKLSFRKIEVHVIVSIWSFAWLILDYLTPQVKAVG